MCIVCKPSLLEDVDGMHGIITGGEQIHGCDGSITTMCPADIVAAAGNRAGIMPYAHVEGTSCAAYAT